MIADIVFMLFSQCPLALSLGYLFYSITTQYKGGQVTKPKDIVRIT